MSYSLILFLYTVKKLPEKFESFAPLFNLDWLALYIRNRKNIEAVALYTDYSKVLLHGLKKVHAFKCIS